MASKPVHEMTNGAPLLRTDEFYVARSPFGVGDDRRMPADNVRGVGGTQALEDGESEGSVEGLALGAVPSCVVLTVQSPSGSGPIVASLVGAPTVDGFDFILSGAPDSANYVLHYHVIL